MKTIPTLFLLLYSLSAQASDETAFYSKCYAHISNSILPSDDPKLKLIKENKLSATDACVDLINVTNINESTNKINLDPPNGPIAIKVLKTMNDFHRSWFESTSFIDALDTGDCGMYYNGYVWDSGEAALHLTDALFRENKKYSSIVTNPISYQGIRRTSNQDRIRSIFGKGEPVFFYKYMNGNKFYPNYISVGQLVGIEPITTNIIDNYLTILENNTGVVDTSFKPVIDFKSSKGAGILGATSYLLLNLGRKPYEEADGGLNMGRRWAKSLVKELLCRDLPVINANDSKPFVNKNSSIPFRVGNSCMQCHTTIDNIAGAIRNYTYVNSLRECSQFRLPLLSKTEVTLPETEYPSLGPDKNFNKRPPTGVFYFRSYNNSFYKKNFIGLEELGKVLTEVDDLYICAAKRYFYFFTAIDVDISPLSKKDQENLTPNMKKYRDFVILTGLKLKKHQSLRSMIKDVISSQYYSCSSNDCSGK